MAAGFSESGFSRAGEEWEKDEGEVVITITRLAKLSWGEKEGTQACSRSCSRNNGPSFLLAVSATASVNIPPSHSLLNGHTVGMWVSQCYFDCRLWPLY